jgi:hypothetical protein
MAQQTISRNTIICQICKLGSTVRLALKSEDDVSLVSKDDIICRLQMAAIDTVYKTATTLSFQRRHVFTTIASIDALLQYPRNIGAVSSRRSATRCRLRRASATCRSVRQRKHTNCQKSRRKSEIRNASFRCSHMPRGVSLQTSRLSDAALIE